jgi:DNA processing protein
MVESGKGNLGNMSLVSRNDDSPAFAPISPLEEMGAYEALWLEDRATFKSVAERFAKDSDALPSDFVEWSRARECGEKALTVLRENGVGRFGIRIHHAGDYPEKLRDARHPVELLYYRGTWDIADTRSVAIVGSRKASDDGIQRAERLARELVKRNITVVSGLASGIDTAAHAGAIEAGGLTIAVIGTPIHRAYPKENVEKQAIIAEKYLLISQVPVLRYEMRDWRHNRGFFPERNATMSALTEATIIVEAGDTSGTLTQARAALYQGRKLLILNSCFENSAISWPAKFEEQGAIRIREPEDIWNTLG